MINAKDPATSAAGMAALTLTAPPVLATEGAAWVEVGTLSGVDVAATEAMLEVGLGVTEFTLIRVLVMVVVETEVVVSAAASWAAARQRKDVMRVLICILTRFVVFLFSKGDFSVEIVLDEVTRG